MTNPIYTNKKFPPQPPESFDGNKEYKWKWLLHDEKTLNKRATQLLYRIIEGGGKAIYIIGIRDNGIPAGISATELEESLSFMSNIVGIINATITGIRVYEANSGVIATIRIIKDISQLQELTI